jgi:hypothetical protein
MSLTDFNAPIARRPGLGTYVTLRCSRDVLLTLDILRAGKRIVVRSNAFQIRFGDFAVYHYDVDMSPDVPTRVKRQVWKQIEQVDRVRVEPSPLYI